MVLFESLGRCGYELTRGVKIILSMGTVYLLSLFDFWNSFPMTVR